MNLVKNLMILALLAGVVYVMYDSLVRNNVEPGRPTGVTGGWPEAPKVDLSGVKPSTTPGGPLALGTGSTSSTSSTSAHGFDVGNKSAPLAPPLTSSSTTVNPPLSGTPAMTTIVPYPSTTPVATLGQPTSSTGSIPSTTTPNTPTAGDAVRNLAPPPEVAATNNAAFPTSDSAAENQTLLQSKFTAFMEAVQKSLGEGKLAEAHLALSSLYDNPDLPPDQSKQITDLLDQLAGTVIYSRKHYLEPAYITRPGDTLDGVARTYNIPWQLLGRINGLVPPGPIATENPLKDQPLPQGRELKVVRGPFEAVVNLEKHELTLMLQKRYAGRFSIGVGRDQPKLDGQYTVHDKTPSPIYRGPDGTSVNSNDPQNPLGNAWIGLTDRIGIHGTNNPAAIGRDDNRGAICVGDRDLQDLYGILSVGSRVTILR